MPPYDYKKLPGEPILIFTAYETYKIGTHLEPSMAEARQRLDAQLEKVYYINDLSRQTGLSVEDLINAAHSLTRVDSAPYHHPMIRRLLVVTTNSMLRLGYKGASSEMFGSLQVELFDTLEEALAYARANI